MAGTPEQGRRDAEKRWAKYRAERIAAGLPPTKTEEKRRKPDRLDDVEVEAYWIETAERLGLTNGLSRIALRRLAKRLADDAVAEEARRAVLDGPATPPVGDDAMLEAFYRGEAARWRQRADRDRQRASTHDEWADDAEAALVALLQRQGRL
ncbi:hypothetical protein ACWEOH_02385 [Agromyces sp. NPDC004153]